jgi:hypothetical protein
MRVTCRTLGVDVTVSTYVTDRLLLLTYMYVTCMQLYTIVTITCILLYIMFLGCVTVLLYEALAG